MESEHINKHGCALSCLRCSLGDNYIKMMIDGEFKNQEG